MIPRVTLLFFIVAAWAGAAHADLRHLSPVIQNPVNYTPQLVATTAVSRPRVDALAQVKSVIYAGGLFQKIRRAGSSSNVSVQNFAAFDAGTGALRAQMGVGYKDPVFNGQVWAIAAYAGSLYVGGDFSAVNGISRRGLVKISAATGKVDTAFNAGFKGGIVWDLRVWMGPNGSTPMLVVAGSAGKKLMGLDLATGRDKGYFNLGIADALPNSWGSTAVYRIDIHGTKLAATGNFKTVQGLARSRFFLANIGGAQAAVTGWYYPGFRKACSSTDARKIAYLQGVDFSPDGSYLVVVATGKIPKTADDIWPTGAAQYPTICDGAARFNMTNDQKPVWVNYTGGDSVWAVSATGAAVYVQGHFEWLDNPQGTASKDGGGAVRRQGIGAINPATGKALAWAPAKPAVIGGKAFLATPQGLWVGSDSLSFAGEARRGIAFVPLP